MQADINISVCRIFMKTAWISNFNLLMPALPKHNSEIASLQNNRQKVFFYSNTKYTFDFILYACFPDPSVWLKDQR